MIDFAISHFVYKYPWHPIPFCLYVNMANTALLPKPKALNQGVVVIIIVVVVLIAAVTTAKLC